MLNVPSKSMLMQTHLRIQDRTYPSIEGTILAFDFGEKRIGVAVGETILKLAHPLVTISTEINEIRFAQIQTLIQEWRPALLVVGLPLSVEGEEHAMTKLSTRFAQRLEGRFSLPVTLVDERFSSTEASQNLKDAGVYGRQQKAMIDQVAAQTILQSYFDRTL